MSEVEVTKPPVKISVPIVVGEDACVEMTLTHKAAMLMVTISNMMADVEDSDAVIPLPAVDQNTMILVAEFAEAEAPNPSPIENPDDSDEAPNPEKMPDSHKVFFVNKDNGTLFKIILAANYLNFQQLLISCAKTIASRMKGKTPEEIRTDFNIKNDLTPEEEEKLRQENEWATSS